MSFSLSGLKNVAGSVGQRLAATIAGKLTKSSCMQRDYTWEFLPPGIGLYSPEQIGQYCQEISFGISSMSETDTVRYAGGKRSYAGNFSIENATLTFAKPSPDVVLSYFDLWRSLIIDDNGFYGVKNDYSLTSYLLIQDTTLNVTSVVKMMGTFPIKFPKHNLSYKNEKISEYQVELNVDHIEFL